MKRITALLLMVCMLTMSLAMYAVGRMKPTNLQRAVRSGELVRIHILAHDDTPQQQALKLQVRDAVLEAFTPLLAQAGSAQEAVRIVRENRNHAVKLAETVLAQAGEALPVTAEFGVFDFPERVYGGQVVPAGEYTALRLRIGNAAGKNWWCVMYPPLCFSGEDYEGEVVFESALVKWMRKWKKKARTA